MTRETLTAEESMRDRSGRASDRRRSALLFATGVGTVLQLAMVLAGHWVVAVADFFGLLGMAISLAAGWLYAARVPGLGAGAAAGGGALAGGLCAFLGIVVSWLMGDVTATILAFGTASSAVTGALGGLAGRALGSRSAGAAGEAGGAG